MVKPSGVTKENKFTLWEANSYLPQRGQMEVWNVDERAKTQRREYMRQYREKNRERIREYQRQWAKDNPDKVKQHQENYWRNKAEQEQSKGVTS